MSGAQSDHDQYQREQTMHETPQPPQWAKAAKNPDWQQVVLNGGPPCFHIDNGKFCFRAKRWAGHDSVHKYISLAEVFSHHAPPEGVNQRLVEQCVCVAIMLSNGEVWRGHRHNDAIHTATQAGARIAGHTQGFITSHNRFVDRHEAMEIQRTAGIPSADPCAQPHATELFSEDLYSRGWRSPASLPTPNPPPDLERIRQSVMALKQNVSSLFVGPNDHFNRGIEAAATILTNEMEQTNASA